MRIWLIISLLLAPNLGSADVRGLARVVDGDTLQVGSDRIRLHGIDAPEASQDCQSVQGFLLACGAAATDALRSMVGSERVDCTTLDIDRYGRSVARCYVSGHDLGEQMVAGGYAVAYRTYSLDYVAAEDLAKARGLGFWSANMQNPADYRAAQRRAKVPVTPVASDCDIKGNISKGGHIYHLPGQRDYAATKISAAKGERWFCTEAAARAAGWRPAKR